FRSTLGFNEIFGTRAFSAGPLTDVSLMVGADANTTNDFIGSAKRSIEAGLTFSFAAPAHGILNLSPNVYKEWQHNGFNPPPLDRVDFETTWGFEYLYIQPLSFVLPESIPLKFKAFGTIHGPKGLNTVMEYYTQENLELDIGKLVNNHPGQY